MPETYDIVGERIFVLRLLFASGQDFIVLEKEFAKYLHIWFFICIFAAN